MTQQLAVRALTPSLGTSPWTLGNPIQGGGDGMSSSEKEACRDVGGHVVGGAANDPRKGALRPRPQQLIAFQASAEKGDIGVAGISAALPAGSDPASLAPVVTLSADPARDSEPVPPTAAGGGIISASAARTLIPHKEEPASATHASR